MSEVPSATPKPTKAEVARRIAPLLALGAQRLAARRAAERTQERETARRTNVGPLEDSAA